MQEPAEPARRGRPRKSDQTHEPPQTRSRGRTVAEQRRIDELAKKRKRRFEGRNSNLKLSLPTEMRDDPNWRYYWAKDTPGRIEQLKSYGYELVEEPSVADDDRNTSGGTRIERHAEADKFNAPVRHYLMRQPIEFYEEDQRDKRVLRQKRMEAIEGGKTPNENGEPIHNDGSYVPRRGINITQGDISQGDYRP
jgi:hypothetical protein